MAEWQRGITWENPVCNYCGCDESIFYLETGDNRFHGRPLRLVKCPGCDLIYASPRPTTESFIRIYGSSWAESSHRFKAERKGVVGWHWKLIEKAMEYQPDAETLFDVGTGSGTVLIAGRRMGLRVAGNDLNRYSCNWLKGEGYTVFNVPTNTLELDERFDLITCFDYIEHTNTPYDDLQWIATHLEEGGILYLKTMYMESEIYKREGVDWSLLSGFHTHYFYRDVLKNMIMDAGLNIVSETLKPEIIHLIAQKP